MVLICYLFWFKIEFLKGCDAFFKLQRWRLVPKWRLVVPARLLCSSVALGWGHGASLLLTDDAKQLKKQRSEKSGLDRTLYANEQAVNDQDTGQQRNDQFTERVNERQMNYERTYQMKWYSLPAEITNIGKYFGTKYLVVGFSAGWSLELELS